MDNNLTLAIPISLTLLSNAYILLFIYLTISFNFFIITICKSNDFKLSTILMSSPYNIVAFNIVATGILKGIVSTSHYTITLVVNIWRNLVRKYGEIWQWAGYVGKTRVVTSTINCGVCAQQINSNYILRFTTISETIYSRNWVLKYITWLLWNTEYMRYIRYIKYMIDFADLTDFTDLA